VQWCSVLVAYPRYGNVAHAQDRRKNLQSLSREMSYLEYPEFYSCEMPKARKEHKCCECLGTIIVGETYQYIAGYWPTVNGLSVFKTCAGCLKIRKTLCESFCMSGEIAFGELLEYVEESGCDSLMRQFAENAKARGSEVGKWLLEQIES
jgi:hypothetical protein